MDLLNRLPVVAVVALASLFATSAVSTASAEPLRWKLKAGDSLRVVSAQEIKSTTSYTGRTTTSTTNLQIESKWNVESVEDETIRLVQQIERVKVDLSFGPDPIAFDSADTQRPKGPARQLQTALAPLLEAKIHLTMNDRGEVLSVDWPATEANQDDKPAADAKDSAPPLAERLKNLAKQTLVLLPPGDAKVGDTWTLEQKVELPGGSPVARTVTYKLAELDEKSATIDQSADVTMAAPAKDVKVKEQSSTGRANFSIEDGIVRSSEWNTTLKSEKTYRETLINVAVESTLKTTIERAK